MTRRILFGGAVLALGLLTGCVGAPAEESTSPMTSDSGGSASSASGSGEDSEDGSISRPSAQELADGMLKMMASAGSGGTFTEEEMLCIATGLEDSDLSNRLLRAMADGDDDATATGEEQTRVNDILTTVMIDCAA